MIPVTAKLAVRSLGRNVRRTLLSVGGVGLGCAMAVIVVSFIRGTTGIYARAAAETGAGHLRVAPEGWLSQREAKLRLADGEAALTAARALAGVSVAAPRARTQALLAMGSRVQSVELVGVEPSVEPRSYRFVRQVVAGRYLREGDRGAVVLGQELAVRLNVEVDDDLVATAVGKGGAMESTMLRVVGLTTAGSPDIDVTVAQVTLADVEQLTGLSRIGEVAVLLEDPKKAESAHAALAAALPPGNSVLTWDQVEPTLANHLKQDVGASRLYSGIATFLVLLGVASAQLSAALERRREFAVLSAIGVKPRQLVQQQLVEALVLGLVGAATALALSVPLVWWFAERGLELRWMFFGEQVTFEGVLMDPKVYTDFGPWLFGEVLVLSLVATLVASIYPAVFAARTDPATALRVAQ